MVTLKSLSEAEAGALAIKRGRRVVWDRGRYWQQSKPGFYEPVHLLSATAEHRTSPPTRACWGCRSVVPPGTDTDTRLVVYFIDDIPGYDIGALTASRRHKLRRAQRSCARLFPLADDALLQREGYEVCVSAYGRFGKPPPTAQQYEQWMATQGIGEQTYGVAATIDGELIGYILAHVIEGTSYWEDFHVKAEALRTNVATALAYELVQMLRDSGAVKTAWNGNVSPDDEGMTRFKTSMGYACTPFPTRIHLRPGAGALLRRWRPRRYERLTGQFDV
jgi:GNAT superfamily N-acetyltransferase